MNKRKVKKLKRSDARGGGKAGETNAAGEKKKGKCCKGQ